ncbi:MAG: hypothetical protein ACN793_02295 [Buchnera aphidicola (Eriosoma harunire)]
MSLIINSVILKNNSTTHHAHSHVASDIFKSKLDDIKLNQYQLLYKIKNIVNKKLICKKNTKSVTLNKYSCNSIINDISNYNKYLIKNKNVIKLLVNTDDYNYFKHIFFITDHHFNYKSKNNYLTDNRDIFFNSINLNKFVLKSDDQIHLIISGYDFVIFHSNIYNVDYSYCYLYINDDICRIQDFNNIGANNDITESFSVNDNIYSCLDEFLLTNNIVSIYSCYIGDNNNCLKIDLLHNHAVCLFLLLSNIYYIYQNMFYDHNNLLNIRLILMKENEKTQVKLFFYNKDRNFLYIELTMYSNKNFLMYCVSPDEHVCTFLISSMPCFETKMQAHGIMFDKISIYHNRDILR